MRLIEIETKLEADGVIRIPMEELKATGLKEGDEVCLMYVEGTCGKGSKVDEFMVERRGSDNIGLYNIVYEE